MAPTVGDAAMSADRPTLRALLWCPAAALHPKGTSCGAQCLTRATAIACTLRLAAKHHNSAEHDNITLTEYYNRQS